MLAVIFGLIAAVLGLWGVISWWPDFVTVVKGALPFMFIVGGIIAIIAGITAIVETEENKNELKAKEEEVK